MRDGAATRWLADVAASTIRPLGDDDWPSCGADDGGGDAAPESPSAPADDDQARAAVAGELEDALARRAFENLALGGDAGARGSRERVVEHPSRLRHRGRQAALVDGRAKMPAGPRRT
jgi:hypothetical protein